MVNKKIMPNTKSVALFLSISSLAIAQACFGASPVYVDATYTKTKSENHTFGVDAFKTIQEGINAVNEDGIVYIKKGTYDEAVTIEKSLSLTGLAEYNTLGASSDAPIIDGNGATGTIFVRGSGATTPINVSIYNLHITHGNHGIVVVQDATMLINNNTIEGYKKNGITFGSKIVKGDGKVSGIISGNNIKGAGPIDTLSQNGIQVADNNTATIIDNTISNNTYTVPGKIWATGILIHNSTGVIVSKNVLVNNQAGINILQASNNTLEDNTILGNDSTDAGIMVTNFDDKTRNATKNTINHNTVTGGYIGIWSSYTPGNRYTNNVITKSAQYGMYLWDSDFNTVSNNTITAIHTSTRGGYGIALNGGDTKSSSVGSDSNHISNNIVTDSDADFYVATNSHRNVIIHNNF
jgi:parallel beta-helix repeat protein